MLDPAAALKTSHQVGTLDMPDMATDKVPFLRVQVQIKCAQQCMSSSTLNRPLCKGTLRSSVTEASIASRKHHLLGGHPSQTCRMH